MLITIIPPKDLVALATFSILCTLEIVSRCVIQCRFSNRRQSHGSFGKTPSLQLAGHNSDAAMTISFSRHSPFLHANPGPSSTLSLEYTPPRKNKYSFCIPLSTILSLTLLYTHI